MEMLNGWVNNIFNTNNEKTYRNHVNVLNKHAIDIKKPSVLNQGKTLHNKQATQLDSLNANLLGFNEDIATPYTNTSPYAYTNTFAKYNTANTYANGETYSNAHTYATTNTYAKGNREGFNTIAISKANEKNSKELQEQNNLSANYADKINRYNTEYPSLLTDTRMYSKGTDRTKNFKENTDELNKKININYNITANKVGCYKKKEGAELIYQSDMNDVTLDTCTQRTFDLEYAGFSIKKKSDGKLGCYVTNDIEGNKSVGVYTKPKTSLAFNTNKDALVGGLLYNGQLGLFKNQIDKTPLATDLPAIPGCDIAGKKHLINTDSITATYGINCNKLLFENTPYVIADQYSRYFDNELYYDADYSNGRFKFYNYDSAKNNQKVWYALPVPGKKNTFTFKSGVTNGCFYISSKNGGEYSITNNCSQALEISLEKNNTSTYAYNVIYNNSKTAVIWKFIPVEPEPYVDCSALQDTDKNLPYKCKLEIWQSLGCTTKSGTTVNDWWSSLTKTGVKNDMNVWATQTDDYSRNACYGPDKNTWPIPPPINCGTYTDTDTNLPAQCTEALWAEAGCTTTAGTPATDAWAKMTKAGAKADINKWATNGNDDTRTRCYGPDRNTWPKTQLVNLGNNKCVEKIAGSNDFGIPLYMNDCNSNNGNQVMQYKNDKYNSPSIIAPNDMCLTILNAGTDNNSKIIQYGCYGSDTASWSYDADKKIRSKASGRCLTVFNLSNENGAEIGIFDCNDTPYQQWDFKKI